MSAPRRWIRALLSLALLVSFAPTDHAHAQGLERLLMPGRVIDGHADTENECGACHDADSDAAVAALCTSCHEDIGFDRENGEGFHGRMPAATQAECITCHTDHEGRDADIVDLDGGLFDHSFTDFELTFAHAQAPCESCHAPDERHREAPTACVDCHRDQDVHEGSLGDDCGSCHNAERWSTYEFDHSSTGYTLTGGHASANCSDCHRNNRYENTPRSCGTCHAIDDVHKGANGPACGDCHSTSTWSSIGFDHEMETGFALVDGHGGLGCNDCHRREDHKDDFSIGCTACHAADDSHQGRHGIECDTCHVPTTWADASFDHDETGFSLIGAHQPLRCNDCHANDLTEPLSPDCGSCHRFDDVHAGQLGNACGDCHAQSDWLEPIVFDHDLSTFPLTGLHATVACGSCHESPRFADAPTTCIDCHRDDDAHDGSLGPQCGDCHSTNGWTMTVFDHDLHTLFPLTEGHAGVACESCHRDPDGDPGNVPRTCGGCHATDDVHDGQFGTQCGTCHTTSTFGEIRKLEGG